MNRLIKAINLLHSHLNETPCMFDSIKPGYTCMDGLYLSNQEIFNGRQPWDPTLREWLSVRETPFHSKENAVTERFVVSPFCFLCSIVQIAA
jgi:hypothetical protein